MSRKPLGILHVGMPKTGTTSIQETFARADLGDAHYWNWPAPNHGGLVALVTGDETHSAVANPDRFAQWKKRLADHERKLEEHIAAHAPRALILSAERIFIMSPEKMKVLRAYLDRFCDDYLVVTYLRDPVTFAASSFQQTIKTGRATFSPTRIYRPYRPSVEALEEAFGRDKVIVRPFDRTVLKDGDVVADFADTIGVPIAKEDIVRDNESMTLEAAALLFVERRFGVGADRQQRPDEMRQNWDFVHRMQRAGGRKFRLSPRLFEDTLARHAEDIAWAEARMGHSFGLDALPKQEDEGPASQAEFLDVALGATDVLRALVRQVADDAPMDTPEDVAKVMHALIPRRAPPPKD
ncbi:hypothetical protein [Pseudaestuariivita atlantica]|uniref:Sulfotransferase domain-containing protein n=1 Tax=Pseudaestuariivita atlantica TaxID=1317121 RepID=A0A0L1JKF1_9RHOB|nr:hypothetical protein [Pseudaestuariivita atlantica]KNG92225.1 hypothetical protein ATO11_18355 [Pseudaestuariivita atlantica]